MTIGLPGVLMLAWRLPVLALVVFGGLAVHLTLRLFERPLFGLRRPVTPHVTQAVCKTALAVIGLPLAVTGRPMAGRGAVVANHVSWLDIFVLNAPQRVYFVSKSEVAGWPGIGWLARATPGYRKRCSRPASGSGTICVFSPRGRIRMACACCRSSRRCSRPFLPTG